jgi:tyrosine-protein phosphatase YwqE
LRRKPKQDFSGAPTDFSFLGVDFHSHLIPGIDDGATDMPATLQLLEGLQSLGFSGVITTPHIHGDFYKNSTVNIQAGLEDVRAALPASGAAGLKLGVSAEYYLDNYFLEKVLPHGLMTFGANQVLVEVSMMGWPQNFDTILFAVQAAGYQPVLAHPERYPFEQNLKTYERLKERGVQLQMNMLAPIGYYGPGVKALALQLLDAGLYDYAATDMHHDRHLNTLRQMATREAALMHRLAGDGFKNIELTLV